MNRLLIGLAATALLAMTTQAGAIPPGSAKDGKPKAQVCMSCHAPDLNNPAFPKIAGQHADYLFHALQAYKSGKRQNPVMAGQVGSLSREDMADLATYFSTLDAGLETLPRK
ncbi:Cytochrome c4 [wastewater metagenome]|uniref:Cytochrome c4 n=3 Tax=root TaxID=1 RepID=A0A5B8R707_9ZZZZ|nr:cytochrome c [Arhodomonas aquaeolei]MCS4505926.1 cytochrome c [Arhodomonas aquaeolei]QEA04486.1 cytochrome c4 [uncultured organism]